MAHQLSDHESAEKYRKEQLKKKEAKLLTRANMLRGAGVVTTVTSSVMLGGLNAWQPQLKDALYGFARPEVPTLVAGIAVYFLAGKSDMTREVGEGLFNSGAAPLSQLLGQKIYEAIAT